MSLRHIVLTLVALVGLLLGGCVTTERTGVVMEPAGKEERIQTNLNLARTYLSSGDTQRARAPLERAEEIDSSNAEVAILFALLYQTEEEAELAESYYKRAVRYDRKSARVRNNYGAFLFAQGRPEDAYKQLELAVQDPDYRSRASAFENFGLVALKLGKTEEATHAFERAITLGNGQPRAHLELATIFHERGDYQQAFDYLRRYREIASATPRSLWLGIQLARLADDANAEASYAMALKNRFPFTPEYQSYLKTVQ